MVNWAKGIDKTTGRPIIDLEAADYWSEGKPKLVFPGTQGAHNWHPMSFNPKTGLAYIPQHTTAEHFTGKKVADKSTRFKWNIGVEIPRGSGRYRRARGTRETVSRRLDLGSGATERNLVGSLPDDEQRRHHDHRRQPRIPGQFLRRTERLCRRQRQTPVEPASVECGGCRTDHLCRQG